MYASDHSDGNWYRMEIGLRSRLTLYAIYEYEPGKKATERYIDCTKERLQKSNVPFDVLVQSPCCGWDVRSLLICQGVWGRSVDFRLQGPRGCRVGCSGFIGGFAYLVSILLCQRLEWENYMQSRMHTHTHSFEHFLEFKGPLAGRKNLCRLNNENYNLLLAQYSQYSNIVQPIQQSKKPPLSRALEYSQSTYTHKTIQIRTPHSGPQIPSPSRSHIQHCTSTSKSTNHLFI